MGDPFFPYILVLMLYRRFANATQVLLWISNH